MSQQPWWQPDPVALDVVLAWLWSRTAPHVPQKKKSWAHLGACLQSVLITAGTREVNRTNYIFMVKPVATFMKNWFSMHLHAVTWCHYGHRTACPNRQSAADICPLPGAPELILLRLLVDSFPDRHNVPEVVLIGGSFRSRAGVMPRVMPEVTSIDTPVVSTTPNICVQPARNLNLTHNCCFLCQSSLMEQ